MEKIIITIPAIAQKKYPIYIGKNLLDKISTLIQFESYTKIIVLTDEIVAPIYLNTVLTSIPNTAKSIIIPSGENNKNIDTLQFIWKKLLQIGADRKSLLINLGGGVIGDIGGFSASTFMRGIDFINIPTTLLAQVDESVGGKTMIDFANIKNIVGTFYQPTAVLFDIQTLQTLPQNQFLSGFAEIIKHGIIKDKTYFDLVTSKKPTAFTDDEIIAIITKSCELKAEIVQEDEKESSTRKLLNFGHTIGHAVEAISLETDKPLLHGEAVSIGMVAEAVLANKIGLLATSDTEIIKKSLLNAGLPTDIPDYELAQIIKKMRSDKKNIDDIINFTLITQIGNGIINQSVSDKILTECIKSLQANNINSKK